MKQSEDYFFTLGLIREVLKRSTRKPTFEELKHLYDNLVRKLNVIHRDRIIRTTAEVRLLEIISKYWSGNTFQSVWIGSMVADVFIPTFKHRINEHGFTGIVFEVDGPIHDNELKMRKDHLKLEFFGSTQILVHSILNKSVKESIVGPIIRELVNGPRLDPRGLRRLWRKIYIITIFTHSKAEFLKAFGVDMGGKEFLPWK